MYSLNHQHLPLYNIEKKLITKYNMTQHCITPSPHIKYLGANAQIMSVAISPTKIRDKYLDSLKLGARKLIHK